MAQILCASVDTSDENCYNYRINDQSYIIKNILIIYVLLGTFLFISISYLYY